MYVGYPGELLQQPHLAAQRKKGETQKIRGIFTGNFEFLIE